MEDSNTRNAKHSLLMCMLWLLACCTAAAFNNYRIMWVSTTGEDSPQCIHDTEASDPISLPRHLNESCGTLNYALKNMRDNTVIVLACGIHELKPYDRSTLPSTIANVGIMGKCQNDIIQIQCTDGANLAIYNAEMVLIKDLAFQDCGKQLQHRDSFSDTSTIYFHDCKRIMLHYIHINITGSYERGISFIREDPTITHGEIFIDKVVINHFGLHGSGIHCEMFTGSTRHVSLTRERIQLKNTHVNVHLTDDIITTFTGINITVMGDGEGGEITLSNVSVKTTSNVTAAVQRTTRSSGIFIALLDRVHGFNVQLNDLIIIDGWKKRYNNECMTDSCVTSYEHLSNIPKNAVNNSTALSNIKIELRGNSMGNHIRVESVNVVLLSAILGSAFSIEIADQSEENVVQLQKVYLQGSKSSEVHMSGLQIILTGWTKRNEVEVTGLASLLHRAYWGGGVYIEFSGRAMGNLVRLRNSRVFHNHALKGGGIAVVSRDFATQNTLEALYTGVYNNAAECGGGVYLILQNISSNNTINLNDINLFNNTAHCGGGMLIQIQDKSVSSRVEVLNCRMFRNTLLPSEKHDMMGGGVHVEFSTVSATFRTDNVVNFTSCLILFNIAGQGVGGGISVLYKHSYYQGDSGDSVIVDTATLFHNMAASGSACSFQSLPIHGKRLFRGIRIAYIHALLFTSVSQTMSDMKLFKVLVDERNFEFIALVNQSIALIQKLLSQTIIPTFQVETNTNMIFAKSVQITAVKALFITCGASSQGIYALDSEIVLKANTWSQFQLCVATHGGAVALYGESYIRVGKNTTVLLQGNHAFQRGGAIYVSSSPGVVPVSNCFLQND